MMKNLMVLLAFLLMASPVSAKTNLILNDEEVSGFVMRECKPDVWVVGIAEAIYDHPTQKVKHDASCKDLDEQEVVRGDFKKTMKISSGEDGKQFNSYKLINGETEIEVQTSNSKIGDKLADSLDNAHGLKTIVIVRNSEEFEQKTGKQIRFNVFIQREGKVDMQNQSFVE